jgi:hypothetical protein
MPILLFWPVPAATIVGGYYLVTAAKVMDAALALAIPTEMPFGSATELQGNSGWSRLT